MIDCCTRRVLTYSEHTVNERNGAICLRQVRPELPRLPRIYVSELT